MERNGWSADKAFDEMKDYDFGWDFLHREFKQFVYGYQPGRVVVAVPAGEGASK